MTWTIRTVALVCLLGAPLTWAQIYKWVDESGNVRFSDKPPPGQLPATVEQVELPGAASRSRKPAVQAVDIATRRAVLETVRYQIIDSELDSDIGKEIRPSHVPGQKFEDTTTAAAACSTESTPMNANIAESALSQGMAEYRSAFHQLLSDNGYNVAETGAAVFAAQTNEAPEISIAALVKKAYFERCARSRVSYNKTDLTIEWQVFDNLARKVLYTVVTEGSDDQFHRPPVRRGHIRSFENAFMEAAAGLLAEKDFLAAVAEGDAPAGSSGPKAANVSFTYGDDSGSFVDTSHLLEQGTVTIRTPSGHGSGFFISGEGHVLTNAHVVTGNERVLVLTSTGQEYARVLHTEPARDVALLQTDTGFARDPLRVSRREPRIGEQIYVVGTPLAEELSFSVTRGIVSGKRTLRGQPLIQTDAAVNRGNSGGPVVDEFGNVIAISVSGIFSESGGSLNTNFLIPIADALAKIGITGEAGRARPALADSW